MSVHSGVIMHKIAWRVRGVRQSWRNIRTASDCSYIKGLPSMTLPAVDSTAVAADRLRRRWRRVEMATDSGAARE